MILSNPLVKSKPFLNELSEGNFLSQVLEDRTPPLSQKLDLGLLTLFL